MSGPRKMESNNRKRVMIYVLGNSHAHLFTRTHYGHQGWGQKTEHFRSFSQRPMSARVLAKTHILAIENILRKMSPEDFLIIAVGERDCSEYIPIECKLRNKPIVEMIDIYLNSFFNILDHLRKNVKIIGWGGHPTPPCQVVCEDIGQKPITVDLSSEMKNRISRLWNDAIRKKYEERGIKFVSILEDMFLENGEVNPDFFLPGDFVHLAYEHTLPIVEKRFKEQGFDVSFELKRVSKST